MKIIWTWGLIILSSLLMVDAVQAASLSVQVNKKSYRPGEQISASVYIESEQESINAMSAVISYPKELLEVLELSTAGAQNGFWVEQAKRDQSGVVNLRWLALNPGYKGKGAKILTINFKAKSAGQVLIGVKDLQVLANDGQGTVVKSMASNASFAVLAVKTPAKTVSKITTVSKAPKAMTNLVMPNNFKIWSDSHPDQKLWYHGDRLLLQWTWPAEVLAMSYLIDRSVATVPASVASSKTESVSYGNLPEGQNYFHIKLKLASGWTKVSNYQVNIDRSSPDLVVSLEQAQNSDLPVLLFRASDKWSGVDYYEISLNNGQPQKFKQVGSLLISNIGKGQHRIRIVAYDKAGNQTGDSKIFDYQPK